MKEAGVTGAKLAIDTDSTAITIKNLIGGDNTNLTLATLQSIARYFSVTTSQLIGEVPLPQRKRE